jgi:hypothetical protein
MSNDIYLGSQEGGLKNWHGERTINPKPVEDEYSILSLTNALLELLTYSAVAKQAKNWLHSLLTQSLNHVLLKLGQ